MPRDCSVRELRNHTADVVAAVRAGDRVSLTVNRMPVADIVPHVTSRDPWRPSAALRSILESGGADRHLLADLSPVRETLVEDE